MKFMGSTRIRTQKMLTLCLVSMFALAGCNSEPPIDHKAVQDFQVEKEWLSQFNSKPAVAHLEAGGSIGDFEDEAPVDESILLPLLKSLEKNHSLEFLNLTTKEDDEHYALVAKIPKEQEVRDAIVDEINVLNERDDVLVTYKLGYRWISLDIFSGEELELLKESGAVEALKEELAMPEE